MESGWGRPQVFRNLTPDLRRTETESCLCMFVITNNTSMSRRVPEDLGGLQQISTFHVYSGPDTNANTEL